MNIEELFQDFDLYAEKSKTQLTGMLSVISEGKVPSRESVSQLDLSIANLRVKYESVVQAAKDQLTDDEMPNETASVSEYVQAVKNSKSTRVKQQIESAKECLQKFISVRSLVAAYTEALSPIQKQASKLLISLDSGENVEISSVEESAAGPRAFLAAIECEDKDSDEGISLCDQVAAFYPGRIYSGVVANKYFIDNTSNNTNVVSDTVNNGDNASGQAIESSENNNTSEEEHICFENSSLEGNTTEAASDNVDVPKNVDSSAFVDALIASGCIYGSDECFGSLNAERSANEGKKVSSTVFRNEMKEGSALAEKEIIKAIDARNNVSEDYLIEIRGMPNELAAVSLGYLFRKGYLRKYSLAPCGDFYCASSRLMNALSFMEASKFVGVKQRSVSKWGDNVEDKASAVASRISFSKTYIDCVSRLLFRNVSSYTETTCILTNSFCGRVFNADDTADCEVIAGAFWETSEECDKFHDAFEDIISNCSEITSIVFAAFDLSCAKSVVDALLSYHDGKAINAPIYLYILPEDKYYIYPELGSLSKDDLRNKESNARISSDIILSESENIVVDGMPTSSNANDTANKSEESVEASKSDPANSESVAPIQNLDFEDSIQDSSEKSGTLDSATEMVAHTEMRDSPKDEKYTDRTVSDAAIPANESNEDLIHRLVNSSVPPTDDALFEMITSILNEKSGNAFSENSYIAQALLLAKAASYSPNNIKCRALYRQLSLATKSPLEEIVYTSENLSNELNVNASETIILASYLFGLLIPGAAYDYSLKGQAEEYLRSFESYFPNLLAVKPLFAKLNTVRDVVPVGFTEAVLTRLGSDTESENYAKSIQSQARNLLIVSTPKTRMKALPSLYSACFGKGSDLYSCLEIVSRNDVGGAELVNIALADYCDEREGNLIINNEKIDQKLDNEWFKVNGEGSSFQLEYAARQQALRQMNNRLSVIKAWAENVNVVSGGKYDFGRLRTLRDEIVSLSDKACANVSNDEIEYKTVIIWALKTISKYLTTPLSATSDLFVELAYTGVISLDEKMQPILPEDLDSVKYYEPWRMVLRHILSPVKSLAEAKEEILDGGEESNLFDNLYQLEVIGNLTGEQLKSSEVQIGDARDTALGNSKDFDDALELAFTYNRISETEKENLAAIKRQHEEAFFERKDFGIWRQFLRALKRRIDELTNSRQAELQRMLDARYAKANGKESPILKEAQLLLNRDLNFAVTEEYINRFDNGEEDFSEELQSVLHEADHFSEFISDEVFNPIYNECYRRRENNFHSVAREYLSRNFPAEWTTRLKEDSLRFVGNKYWPNRKDTTTPGQMVSLFNWLGMNVARAERINNKSEEMFRLEVTPSPRSMADYRHPISLFGTQAKSQMNVVVLHGNNPAKQLVDKITGLGLGGMSIVVLNYPINLAVRRQIAEEFHKTTGQNPFILIDQTLVIYLALHQITERLPIMLKCSLPYTTYQPFVRDGGSTADEMFFGRSKELATIKDPNGACVVYGGRQLGKTALLERAESLCYKPENHAYAVYCNILNCTTEENMVQIIAEDVQKKTSFKFQNCKTIKELCNEFEKLFLSGKMESMLLLLDETDKFLGAIAEQDYAQLQPLIDLKRSTKNNFKFVLAGLHNVCRAKNATARNGVFGQLGTPLCVKPLSPTDALQLLSRPLRYLGFQIDRYPHLETILTNTNYYPGILQFFGYMLVETLSTHYGKYYRAVDGNPPYTLQDDQLGAVMNSADLNRSIRDKFRWSLELDQRYFMIARCIAVLYYLSEESTNTWLGFSIEEIMDIASSYDIHCLKKESENDYKNLLDEMVEMGILSKPDTEKNLYRLRRSSFINIIGSDFEAVDADISKNNLEVE